MNEAERKELEHIHLTQAALRRQLDALDTRIHSLEAKLTLPVPKPSPIPAMPPPLPVAPVPGRAQEPVISPVPEPKIASASMEPGPGAMHGIQTDVPRESSKEAKWETEVPTPEPRGSLEMQLGRVWLVRIGVVLLLTGFIFLANYTYQTYIAQLGAWGKLGLLAMAGAALGFAGSVCEKRSEQLKNFGRVLLAGGIATLYYAAYASHYVPTLRVIESPVVAGFLLLGVAGGIVWAAHRRQSQTIAIIAILLCYYSAAINPVAGFTLFSNLLLTACGVWFLVRNRWSRVTTISLGATYLSHFYWRFLAPLGGATPWESARHTPFEIGMLAGYWVLFTIAVFAGANESFRGRARAAFASANNVAFFSLASATLLTRGTGQFWLLALVFGGVLIGLSWLARRFAEEEYEIDGNYLAQGIVIATVGLVARASGFQLALMLTAESALLLALCRQRHAWIYQLASAATAGMGFGFGLVRILFASDYWQISGAIQALLFLFDARWFKHLQKLDENRFSKRAAYWVTLALGMALMLVITWSGDVAWFGPLLVAIAAFAAWSLPLHGLVELAILAQGFVLLALPAWLRDGAYAKPGIFPGLAMLGGTLSLAHWWQRRKETASPIAAAAVPGMAFLFVGLLAMQIEPRAADTWRPFLFVLTTFGCIWYARLTGMRVLGFAAQLLVLFSVGSWFFHAHGGEAWWGPLLFLAALVACGVSVERANAGGEPTSAAFGFPILYRSIALVIFVGWIYAHVPSQFWFPALGAGAIGLFAVGAWTRNRERLWFAAGLGTLAMLQLWLAWVTPEPWTTLGVLVVALGFLAVTGKRSLPGEVRDVLNGLLLASAWLEISRWIQFVQHSFFLTVAWSILAIVVLGTGIVLRDRIYRWGGLVILAAALGRVFLFDVWQLGMLGRTLSFLVLGVVLIAVSFLYNKLADRLREWM